MPRKKANKSDGLLVSLSTFFVKRWKAGLAVWLTLIIGGALVYTNVISREGFPPISFPLSIVSGTYIVDDPALVDQEVAAPISEALTEIEDITGVTSSAGGNFFSVQVNFDESLNSFEGTDLVRETIESRVNLPEQVELNYIAIDPGSFLFEYDMIVQVYSSDASTAAEIDGAAEFVAEKLNALGVVARADAQNNVSKAIDPRTGKAASLQSTFSKVGISAGDKSSVSFYNSTVIGVDRVEDEDIIELAKVVDAELTNIDLSQFGVGTGAAVTADFASDIETQINFLETNMATGLIAVAIVSFLLITWRASLITALFMLSVMVATIVVLYFIGYTLNTITLFALILSLGLFVDDATIVVEAIDVSKRKKKYSDVKVIGDAIRRVGRASLSGTLTTVLVFAILATPTGILGQFIRLIPITVVVALILSFILSITLIPLLSKFIVLKNREPSAITRHNPVLKLEEWLASGIERTVLSVRTRKGKLYGAVSLLLSVFMVVSGFFIFGTKVDNNTFPPAKDSDQIGVQVNFRPGTTIEEAQNITSRVETIVSETVGSQVVQASYGTETLADARRATLVIDLVPFTERDVKSPELVSDLETAIEAVADTIPASVVASQIDNGPPSDEFPFSVRVFSEDSSLLGAATDDMAKMLTGQELTNFNGDKINILDSRVSGLGDQINRKDGERFASVRFSFDSDNATLVTQLAEKRFEDLYGEDELASLNITQDSIAFDAGQEGDFQDSFDTLVIAIPVSLLLMYLLLVVQFRSLVQPWLILLAIPFTMFGVAAGLAATNNPASFFALTGFIGLIGIAVNNTIMLTDYANQERRDGKGAVEAIASASRKRFRPLLATSITTVVALLPLALSDPFWEALAFTIIFGLLSSTFLVIISFPYYYLGLEYLRRRTRRLFRRG